MSTKDEMLALAERLRRMGIPNPGIENEAIRVDVLAVILNQAADMLERSALRSSPSLPTKRAIAHALCKRRNTKQCAAVCLSHSCLNDTCPEEVIVFGNDADAILQLLTPSPAPALEREAIRRQAFEECARLADEAQARLGTAESVGAYMAANRIRAALSTNKQEG